MVAVVVLLRKDGEDDGVSREPPPPRATVKLLPWSWTLHWDPCRIGQIQAQVSLRQQRQQRPCYFG